MAAVVNDQQDAAAVLGAPEHDNVFVGESVAEHRIEPGRKSFSFSRAKALSTSAWRAASTSPSRCSPSTSIGAPQGFAEELGIDLRAEVFDGTGGNLERTDRAQPALFAVEYALAKLIESYGVRPCGLAGHSIGEYVAATIAGVFDLPTAIKAVSMRARLMHAAPRGVMVAVALSPDAIAEYLSARRRSRRRQRSRQLRRRGIPRKTSASSRSALAQRGLLPVGSGRRMHSIRG